MTLQRLCLLLTLVATVITLIFAVLMQSGAPDSLADSVNGYNRPIFAVYFARTLEDLAFITGPQTAEIRTWMHGIQALDTWFPLAYGGMAILFFAAMGLRGQRLAFLGIALAAAAVGADWAENEVANRILADLDAGVDPTERLDAMWGHTWIKWGFIAAYAAVLSALMGLDKRPRLAILPGAAAIALTASWVTGADPAVFRVANILLVLFMLTFPVAAGMYLIKR